MKKRDFWVNLLFTCLFAVFVGSIQSCSLQDLIDDENKPEAGIEELNGLTAADLRTIKTTLINEGREVNADVSEVEKVDIDEAETKAQGEAETRGAISTSLVRIFKISKPMTINGIGSFTASGVLLVPRSTSLAERLSRDTNLRIIVVGPPTYTDNASAPSKLFSKSISMYEPDGDLNMMYFYALQAMEHFAVFIPDYPGFGDSNDGRTYNPYVLYDPLVESTYQLLDVARAQLTKLKKKYKPDVIFTGYSEGAYTAMALSRTSDLDGSKAGVGAEATIAGGTPIDLLAIFQDGIKAETLSGPQVYGYAAFSYYKYYSNIDWRNASQYDPSNVLAPRYANLSYLAPLFDGSKDHVNEYFPSDPKELFSQNVLNGNFGLLGTKLTENSIKPWKNSAPIYLIHGTADDVVYYNQIEDFMDEMRDQRGEYVHLTSIPRLKHVDAAVSYFIELVFRIQSFR